MEPWQVRVVSSGLVDVPACINNNSVTAENANVSKGVQIRKLCQWFCSMPWTIYWTNSEKGNGEWINMDYNFINSIIYLCSSSMNKHVNVTYVFCGCFTPFPLALLMLLIGEKNIISLSISIRYLYQLQTDTYRWWRDDDGILSTSLLI